MAVPRFAVGAAPPEWKTNRWTRERAVLPLGEAEVGDAAALDAQSGPRPPPPLVSPRRVEDGSGPESMDSPLCALALNHWKLPPVDWTLEETVAKMSSGIADLSTQQRSCMRLWELAASSKEAVTAAGGIQLLCAAIAAHPGSEVVAAHACGALWTLAVGSPDNKIAIGKAGIDEVCAVMTVHLASEEVQTNSCGLLWSASCNSPANKVIAAGAKAVLKVCATMQTHAKNQTILRHACGAIANLCGCSVSQEQAHSCHAEQLVLMAMVEFPSEEFQEQASAALSSLTCCNSVNQVAAIEFGAVRQLCLAMNSCASSASVQQHACAALRSLSCQRKVQATMVAAGAVQRVCEAMDTHADFAPVQLQAFAVLRNLYHHVEHKDVVPWLGTAGAIQGVCAGMLRHESEMDVQLQGCAALRSLACHVAHRPIATECRAIERVCNAMNNHKDSEVQEQGCAALHNLACFAYSPEYILSVGGQVQIEAALAAHVTHAGVQTEGNRALERLAL